MTQHGFLSPALLALSACAFLSCGKKDGALRQADLKGEWKVTAITCNGATYTDAAPSDFSFKFDDKSGFYRVSGGGCTYTYHQTLSWNGSQVNAVMSSCEVTGSGGCSCAGATVDLGPASFSREGDKTVLTQNDADSEFGEECEDTGEGGLPAKLFLEKI